MPTQYSRTHEVQITFEAVRAGFDHLTIEELQLLKQELEQRLEEAGDWLDMEYVAYARQHGDPTISLDSVRKTLAKIKGSMSDVIIDDREDRF